MKRSKWGPGYANDTPGGLQRGPNKLDAINKMMEEHCWIDVGEVANWWGGKPGMPACHAKAGATPSRIDGIVCNLEAAVLTHSSKVGNDKMMQTHSIVKINVSRNAMKQQKELRTTLATVEEGLRNKD